MERAHLLRCINAADDGGFPHYAGSLRALYEKEFGQKAPGPVAAAVARPLFFKVTGADFRRSIDWASTQPPGALSNEGIRAHVAEHKQRQFSPGGCQESASSGVTRAPMPAHPGQ